MPNGQHFLPTGFLLFFYFQNSQVNLLLIFLMKKTMNLYFLSEFTIIGQREIYPQNMRYIYIYKENKFDIKSLTANSDSSLEPR